jgi:hypothetical protein
MAVGVGFFGVSNEIGSKSAAVCQRIREICGEPNAGFPFRASPVVGDDGNWPMLYAAVSGHVPIHIDRQNAHQHAQSMFMFILEAENRPVLLTSPADRDTAKAILVPEEEVVAKAFFGGLELWPGRAIHLDPTRQFHGITAFPTGDPEPTIPSCVMVQVPWARADDIGGAIATMKRCFRRDERFADLITPAKGAGS